MGLARATLALTMILVPGCRREAASAREPASVAVAAYVAALRADDARRAYGMLSEAVRRDLPFEAFSLSWRDHQAERRDQAERLADGLKRDGDVGERAKVTFADGTTCALTREAGHWHLDTGLLAATHAASPHMAIELFADALAARSYEGVMQVLTSRRRDGLGQKVDLFLASLKKQLADAKHRVEFVGKDRAELGWDDGDVHYKVVLRLESDEWRIDDVHVEAVPTAPAP